MDMGTEKLMRVANTIAAIAISIEKKVFYFLIIGIASIATIAWHWIDFSTLSFGLALKILMLSLPVLFWFLLWNLVKQLTELPQNLVELKEVGAESLSLVSNLNQTQKKTPKKSVIASLFRLVKTIREPEIFERIFVCAKGLTLLVNPISFIALILSALAIIIFIFIALGVTIF